MHGKRSTGCTSFTKHLSYRKVPQIAAVAVARELVGFLWAVMREVEPTNCAAAQ
jgi:hypothetical protein